MIVDIRVQAHTPGRAAGGGALGGATPAAGVPSGAAAVPVAALAPLRSQDAIKSIEGDLADKDKKFYSVAKCSNIVRVRHAVR